MEDIYSYSNGRKPQDWRKECFREPQGPRRPPKKQRYKPPKKGAGLKIFLSVLIVILALVVAGGAFYVSKLNKINNLDLDVNSNKWVDQESLYQDEEVINIMLVGVDRRSPEERGRSDTMMLLSVDNKHGELKMTSFLRDSWVTIPGKGENRLNAAYNYGGPELLLDTIEYNFNIRVDRIAVVDFTAFEKVIDILGGVEVDITEKEAKFLRKNHQIDVQAGLNKLNGADALWYCRIRKLDSDFGRTNRQRKFVTAVVNASRNANVAQMNTVLDNVLPLIDTNLSNEEITQLGLNYVSKYSKYDVGQFSVPADGTWRNEVIKGAQVLGLDLEKNQKLLYDFIYGDAIEEDVTE